jgi:hypothetical protein
VDEQDVNQVSNILTAEYQVSHTNAIQGWSAHVELNNLQADNPETNQANSALLLRAAATYQRYYSPSKKIQVRLFGGCFLQGNSQSEFVIGLSSSPDYRRQTPFLDRQQISPALAAQRRQTDNRDGAFKAFVPVYSNQWLSTLNVQADVPALPLGVFADFGATGDLFQVGDDSKAQRLFYDAGLAVPLFGNVVRFYFPVAGSQFANGLPKNGQEFIDGIRFVLNLNQINPFKLLDETLAK